MTQESEYDMYKKQKDAMVEKQNKALLADLQSRLDKLEILLAEANNGAGLRASEIDFLTKQLDYEIKRREAAERVILSRDSNNSLAQHFKILNVWKAIVNQQPKP